MAFDPTVIRGFRIDPVPSEPALHLSWSSTSPAGTIYQVYVDGRLRWYGPATRCALPWPVAPISILVGAVGPGEGKTSFSGSLPAVDGAARRAQLTWLRSPGAVGYRIYGEPSPGAGIDYSRTVAFVPASASSSGGFGRGAFGRGAFGRGQVAYRWRSRPLTAGTWAFAIKPLDSAGVLGSATTVSATIAGPPGSLPAVSGKRVQSSYNSGTRALTLTWQPIP